MTDENGKTDLLKWLEDDQLGEALVTVKGKQFLVVEISLAEQGELLSKHADKKGDISNDTVEAVLMTRCVCDPDTRQPVVPADRWELWRDKGTSFIPLRRAVIQANGLGATVEGTVKN